MKMNSTGNSLGPQSKTPRKSKSTERSRRYSAQSKPDVKPRFPLALIEEHFAVGDRPVTFAFFSPDAQKVFLAGAFNEWDPKRTPLARRDTGRWEVEISLKPGTYEYRLVVDGVWQEDPMSPRFAANPFGGLNSVIVVTD
jgi:1,4-alpha-glucan branching enzyme